jgi:hypothetical protein
MPVHLLVDIRRRRPAVAVMEGTGVAGGLAVLMARLLLNTPYVVSSGDAVAEFVSRERVWIRPIARVYERMLYRNSSAVIGWSPYIVGRAITMGATRAATAAHWATGRVSPLARQEVRRRLGIPEHAIVFGLVGSLNPSRGSDWCYGVELIRALRATDRPDLRVLIVGDGKGRARLEALAGDELGRRVLLAGACEPDQVLNHLAAMDIGSLPQTRDPVGALRYTTKLSEYVEAGLPVVTGQIPLAYDLGDGWMWRLPGLVPWEERYIDGLAALMESVSTADIEERRALVPRRPVLFDRETQCNRVAALIADVVAECERS